MDNRYDNVDPRPTGLKTTSSYEVNSFIIRQDAKDMGIDKRGNPIQSNWCSMKLKYEDYDLTLERMLELVQFQRIFIENLKKDKLQYDGGQLSNRTAIHIDGTEDQSEGAEYAWGYHKNLWFKLRVLLITASWFKVRNVLFT